MKTGFKRRLIGESASRLMTILALFLGIQSMSAIMAVTASAETGYNDGFYIKSDDNNYLLKTKILLQPQYQALAIENQNNVHTFQMRRARLIFKGNAINENLAYVFNFETVNGSASTAIEGQGFGVRLLDAYINYRFNDGIQIRAGQFKQFYNREELSPSEELQLVDTGVTNDVFSLQRDLGVALHGRVFDRALEWGVFVANEGRGLNTANPNNELLVGARLVYNVLGHHGYTMSDVGHSEDPNLALGFAGSVNRPTTDAGGDNTIAGGTIDVAFRYLGLSFIAEGHYARNTSLKTGIFGALGQIGYFIIPEHLELAARGAAVIPRAGTNGYELGPAINYFFKGHNLKIQADYAALINSALAYGTAPPPLGTGITAPGNFLTGGVPGFVQDQVDHRFRLQTQLYF